MFFMSARKARKKSEREIIKNVDVMVDGRYIDSQRDITLKWRGSKNQRVILVKESLKKGEIVTMG